MGSAVHLIPGIEIGGDRPPVLIAGPCLLESEDLALRIGEKVLEICRRNRIQYVFKSSFDKANRTSGNSQRGPGIEQGLEMLSRVHEELGVPILTDFHEPPQAALAAEVADILQVPAFLCRQTDMLIAAGRTGKAVNIKKGQFMAPEDMKYAVDKVLQGGEVPVTLTERGSSFGYRNLVVDLRSLAAMREFAPVIFDGTHSVQSPGSAGGKTGGKREWVSLLVRGAVAAGVDGIFLEVHTDPDSSPSDATNMITPETLEEHLPLWLELHRVVREAGISS